MASWSTTEVNAVADFRGGRFDQGANPNPSKIQILHSDLSTVIAEVPMDADAFAPASNGTITMNGLPKSVTASHSLGVPATATRARLVRADGSVAIPDLTVGTTNAHVILDNVSLADGQTFQVTNCSYTETAALADPA